MTRFYVSTWIVGMVVILCAGVAGAEASAHADSAGADGALSTATAPSEAVSAALTGALDAETGRLVAPSDHTARTIAQQLRNLYIVQSEALDKAGLMVPETMANGLVRQRLGFEHMSSSIVVNPFGEAAVSCVQPGSHVESADAAEQPAASTRLRSTPSVEGWVDQ